MLSILGRKLCYVTIVLAISLVACGQSTDTGSGGGTTGSVTSAANVTATSGTEQPTSSSTGVDPFTGCSQGIVESDSSSDVPLNGPGIDPMTGSVTPGQYVIATTYLALVPSQTVNAKELGGAVIASLPTMSGLVAVGVTSSKACASLRTLTVWKSEEDMMAFVMSDAHANAMAQISTLSRGTSNLISWEGNETDVSWAAALAHLASTKGGNQ
jgi:heme-degrading monooxygenase HmoA